jgi:His-Xaa-Ser system protein HxsD
MNHPVLGSLLEYKLYYIMNSGNDKIIVVVDLNLYKKEVITAALYKFTHLFYIHQETDSYKSNLVQIIFESKDDIRFDKDISKEFGNELIDQQLRYDTNIQFGHIRDLIVEEAFKPVNVKR